MRVCQRFPSTNLFHKRKREREHETRIFSSCRQGSNYQFTNIPLPGKRLYLFPSMRNLNSFIYETLIRLSEALRMPVALNKYEGNIFSRRDFKGWEQLSTCCKNIMNILCSCVRIYLLNVNFALLRRCFERRRFQKQTKTDDDVEQEAET